MVLSIIGIGESSKVATGIFIFHLVSLVLLSITCFWFLIENGVGVFTKNLSLPVEGGILQALFFGFAAAMLGISGFESSANFVEEQKKRVFRKTLRNMWIVVTVFNPLMAFLALSIIPMEESIQHQEALLSHLGLVSGGKWLSIIISADAALVLSGAVLTSYVGVSGLVQRMTLDRILPQFLLKKNKRKSPYWISILFFVLCVSILLITRDTLGALAGVYTIAFLSVMFLFGMGNILLKVKRKHLPRPEQSSWPSLLLALIAVVIALLGNSILNPPYLVVFLEYFIPTLLLVSIMLNRVILLKLVLRIVRYFFVPLQNSVVNLNKYLFKLIESINAPGVCLFHKG